MPKLGILLFVSFTVLFSQTKINLSALRNEGVLSILVGQNVTAIYVDNTLLQGGSQDVVLPVGEHLVHFVCSGKEKTKKVVIRSNAQTNVGYRDSSTAFWAILVSLSLITSVISIINISKPDTYVY